MAALNPGFAEGVNIDRGRVTNRAVASTFNLPYVTWDAPVASVA